MMALIELWALAKGWWTYGVSMPTILSIGLAPLLQWIIVALGTLVLFRTWARRRQSAPR